MHRTAWAWTAVLLACLLAGCSTVVNGQVVYTLNDPFRAGGLPVTEGPSGIRDDAPDPTGTVVNTDGSAQDELALLSANDVEEFWSTNYNPSWDGGKFVPVEDLVSYDSTDPNSPLICGIETAGSPNAFFYKGDGCDLIAWDRGAFVPAGQEYFGDFSIAALLAHEYGHAVQFMAGLASRRDPVVVREQQADCFAGAYTAWVAEGNSKRFQLSTGEGLTLVLAAVLTIADEVLTESTSAGIATGHGTALDRISAFQIGFINGPNKCAEINAEEIDNRRKGLPLVLEDEDDPQAGNVTISEGTLESLMEVSGEIFSPQDPPTLSFDSADCPDARPSGPASYCPATNTISVDLPKLQQLGTPADESDLMLIAGDNTALSIVMSRYALAVQHERGEPLDTPVAALRTACITGVGQRAMAEPDGSLVLTAGDLDEAVAGLLVNGLVASDVNGVKVPAGFTRITAFRAGVQTDMANCFDRFKAA